jgi:hypothetical protein
MVTGLLSSSAKELHGITARSHAKRTDRTSRRALWDSQASSSTESFTRNLNTLYH